MSEENANADGADNTGAAEGAGTDGTAIAAAAAGADGADGGDGNEGGDTALSDAGADGGGNDGGQDGGEGSDGSDGGEGGDKPEEGEDGVAPEAYEDFAVPDGLEISEADKVVFSDVAKELNLSQGQAQKLVDMQSKFQQDQMSKSKEAQQGVISEMRAEADKLPKDTLVAANRFVQQHGSDELKQKMGNPSYYIGNDVDIINAFAKAQQAVDGGFVDGDAAGAEVSAAKTLYG